jgi:RHS repeat-associated protein
LVSRTAGGSTNWYTFDPQGNTALIYQSVFNFSNPYVTDAYGNLVSGTSAVPYDGFGAQYGNYHDPITGWYLMGHRFYAPGQGRFINRDPIGYGGGINLYAYTGNDPMNGADPSGFSMTGAYQNDRQMANLEYDGMTPDQAARAIWWHNIECEAAFWNGLAADVDPWFKGAMVVGAGAAAVTDGLSEEAPLGALALGDAAEDEGAAQAARDMAGLQPVKSNWQMGRDVHTNFGNTMRGDGMRAPNWNQPGADFTNPNWNGDGPQFGELKPYNPGGINSGINQINGRFGQGMTGPGALYVYGADGNWQWHLTVLPPGYFGG